mmetsp:Transcript_294/g.394  ORF Transcript_294/g.394 Transcript_294/m.394 type:complete len:251 (+) Transcript_294:1784-2536(+)
MVIVAAMIVAVVAAADVMEMTVVAVVDVMEMKEEEEEVDLVIMEEEEVDLEEGEEEDGVETIVPISNNFLKISSKKLQPCLLDLNCHHIFNQKRKKKWCSLFQPHLHFLVKTKRQPRQESKRKRGKKRKNDLQNRRKLKRLLLRKLPKKRRLLKKRPKLRLWKVNYCLLSLVELKWGLILKHGVMNKDHFYLQFKSWFIVYLHKHKRRILTQNVLGLNLTSMVVHYFQWWKIMPWPKWKYSGLFKTSVMT